jgi:hypothetical protein
MKAFNKCYVIYSVELTIKWQGGYQKEVGSLCLGGELFIVHVIGSTPNPTSFKYKCLMMNYQLKYITTPYFTLMAIITLSNYKY